MSASIALSNLSWSAPDGRPLFTGLTLSFEKDRTGLIGRNGVGKTTLLKLISGDLVAPSGRVSIDGTIGVLRQCVQVGAGETMADLFGMRDALALLRRAESGDATVDEIGRADWTVEARIAQALARTGLDPDATTHLATLSGGQRTRAGLAALVFAEPDFILLDEPTNNLDRAGRQSVLELLAGWRAGAIVVSHDRELLEAMDAIVEISSLGATRYGGNWSHYRERKALELGSAQRNLADAEKRLGEIAQSAQAAAERKARKNRAGQKRRAKGDIPRIMLNALRDRSEKTGGENARLAERRRTQALQDAGAARGRIEVLQPLSIALAPTGLPASRTVVHLDRVSAGHAPGQRILDELSFTMTGPERVAITGPNGSGKTTLLSVVAGALVPRSGSARTIADRALLDQQMALLDATASIRDNFSRLNPAADENACRAALARFMFRAEAARQIVSTLSGGQLLRAGLACVLGGATPPSLLLLDEPTNHLDIDSIEAVEAGLGAYDGALLVVSHDEAFLDSIGITRRIDLSPAGSGTRHRTPGTGRLGRPLT